jgi:hypothetical protein
MIEPRGSSHHSDSGLESPSTARQRNLRRASRLTNLGLAYDERGLGAFYRRHYGRRDRRPFVQMMSINPAPATKHTPVSACADRITPRRLALRGEP